MVDLDVTATDDLIEAPTETAALADEQTPDVDANEPLICDPIIGFVCPKAMGRQAL